VILTAHCFGQLSLERVLGVSSTSTHGLAVHPTSGDIAYTAGTIAIIYNTRKNKQTKFLSSSSNNPVQCVEFSSTGRYLAVGERGESPSIKIWDLNTDEVTTKPSHREPRSCSHCSTHEKPSCEVTKFLTIPTRTCRERLLPSRGPENDSFTPLLPFDMSLSDKESVKPVTLAQLSLIYSNQCSGTHDVAHSHRGCQLPYICTKRYHN